MSPTPEVLLATCAALPEGEPGGDLLVPALAELGVSAAYAAWDDPGVDWSAGLVAVRSTWDYWERLPEFLTWARGLPRMLNSAALFAWNLDKSYLLGLAAAGLPVVPTLLVEEEGGLPAAVAEVSGGAEGLRAVVKPCVGAGGRGVVVFDGEEGGPAGLDESGLWPAPWIVQPLVESVRTEGEWSAFVLGGEVVSAARKRPGGEEIRVHPEYGGRTTPEEPSVELRELALAAWAACERATGERLDYARVDALRQADGTLAVSEIEATEPGLYLQQLPGNAAAYARLCVGALGR